jgi:tol-pal system protein YbgF
MLPSLLALAGCAAVPPPARTTPAEARATAVDPDHEIVRAQRERIRELEAQLALAHAEAGALRSELRGVEASARTQATRIAHPPPPEVEPVITEERAPSGPRPVLRLHGPTPSAASLRVLDPIPGPPAPAVAAAPPLPSLRLPTDVAPRFDPGFDPAAGVPRIPEAPVVVAPPPAPAPRDDGAVRTYREALAHMSARRLDEALAGLDTFLRAHPGHAYAGNAMYWRGEIHYARRDYRRALAELIALVERFPQASKIPEALLRIGLCHARMGDPARARQVFERLRTDYPRSVAARMVPEEDV